MITQTLSHAVLVINIPHAYFSYFEWPLAYVHTASL